MIDFGEKGLNAILRNLTYCCDKYVFSLALELKCCKVHVVQSSLCYCSVDKSVYTCVYLKFGNAVSTLAVPGRPKVKGDGCSFLFMCLCEYARIDSDE